MVTAAELIQYYQSKIILQYNGLPKASGTIAALTNCSICDNFFTTLQNCFSLYPNFGTLATGKQLQIIGRIVGITVPIYGLDLVDTFMSFSNWTGEPASVGYNYWGNATPDPDKWASWLSTAIYTPTDFEMLALIRLKIMRNNYFPSLGVIVPALWSVFGSAIQLTDNLNKSIAYSFASPYHNVGSIAQFVGNICPKPMGCACTYNLI